MRGVSISSGGAAEAAAAAGGALRRGARGVHAHVIYSPTTTQLRFEDPLLRAACLAAYNDWAAEFNRAAPDRLFALADLPCHDPKAAREELLRVAKLGLRGAIVHQGQGAEPIFETSWEPFWDAVQETGLPISVHLGPGTHSLRPQLGSWRFPAFVAVVPIQLDEVLAGTPATTGFRCSRARSSPARST